MIERGRNEVFQERPEQKPQSEIQQSMESDKANSRGTKMSTSNLDLKRRSFLLKAVLPAILVLATYAALPAGVPSGIPLAHVEVAKASGFYTVQQCHDGYGAAHGWVAYNPSGAFSTENSACPGAAGLRWYIPNIGYWPGQYAQWYINAPPYTTIYRWTGHGRKWSNGMIMSMARCWDNVGGCDWFFSPNANTSYTWFDTGAMNMVQVSFHTGCFGSYDCIPFAAGRIEGSDFEFTMYDGTNIWIDPLSGSLFNGGWVKGTQDMLVHAHDTGSGVRQIGWRLDGGATQEWYGPACHISGGHYDSLAPCPEGQWKYYSINTANFSDGCHMITGVGQEVADAMQVTTDGWFCSDNTFRHNLQT